MTWNTHRCSFWMSSAACEQMDLGDCKMNYQERQQNLFPPPVAFLYSRDWGFKNQLAFFCWWATVRKMLPSNSEHHWKWPLCRISSRCLYTWLWTTNPILQNKHLWLTATPENISQVPWEKEFLNHHFRYQLSQSWEQTYSSFCWLFQNVLECAIVCYANHK